MFNLSKRRFAKAIMDNGIVESIDRIYRRLEILERINKKLVFSELYDSNPGLLKNEIEFLRQLSSITADMSCRKQIEVCVLKSNDNKITDYLL